MMGNYQVPFWGGIGRKAHDLPGRIKMINRSLVILIFLLTTKDISALECIYAPKVTEENPYNETYPQGDCGEIVDGDVLKLQKKHFERLSFTMHGLAWIIITEPRPIKAYYVSKNGKVVRTHFYDNAADYFEEGLARTISNNKFGYIDKDLKIVIKPQYDFAFPFQSGYAIVCNQCKPEPTGEHKKLVGGTWGVINRYGEIKIPISFKQDELVKSKKFKKLYDRPWPLLY